MLQGPLQQAVVLLHDEAAGRQQTPGAAGPPQLSNELQQGVSASHATALLAQQPPRKEEHASPGKQHPPSPWAQLVVPAGQMHAPLTQTAFRGHGSPQAPQFASSLDRSTHVPAQSVVPGGQPVGGPPESTTQAQVSSRNWPAGHAL